MGRSEGRSEGRSWLRSESRSVGRSVGSKGRSEGSEGSVGSVGRSEHATERDSEGTGADIRGGAAVSSHTIEQVVGCIPSLVQAQTNAHVVVLLVRDSNGENHIVAKGQGWKSLLTSAAARVLNETTEESSVAGKEVQP